MTLDPAKPIPKKSVLHQKVGTFGGKGLDALPVLPPIGSKAKQVIKML